MHLIIEWSKSFLRKKVEEINLDYGGYICILENFLKIYFEKLNFITLTDIYTRVYVQCKHSFNS